MLDDVSTHLIQSIYEFEFFPKIDHSGSSTIIIFEPINSVKKVTTNRNGTCDPRTVVLTSCVDKVLGTVT